MRTVAAHMTSPQNIDPDHIHLPTKKSHPPVTVQVRNIHHSRQSESTSAERRGMDAWLIKPIFSSQS